MGFLSFQIHGAADKGGLSTLVDSILAFAENLAGQSPEQFFALLLPGISALQNWHPLWVHFPIAFITGFWLFDILGLVAKKTQWRVFAGYLLHLGAICAIFTVVAGLMAAKTIPHGGDVHEIMENHEHLGISVLILALCLSAWRWFRKVPQGGANTLFVLLSTILWVLLMLTADLGGLMVYQYGVAVKPVQVSGEFHAH